MLQCGTRVFRTPKSQIMPIDFATQVKGGFGSEHSKPFTASRSCKSKQNCLRFGLSFGFSEHFGNVELVSVANRNLESFPFMLYLYL
jgi:hypothetical protein